MFSPKEGLSEIPVPQYLKALARESMLKNPSNEDEMTDLAIEVYQNLSQNIHNRMNGISTKIEKKKMFEWPFKWKN